MQLSLFISYDTNLEVVLLGQVITVMAPGTGCLCFTTLFLVPKVLLLDLLLQMLLVS